MSNYLERLVRPAIANPVRTAQAGLEEIEEVVAASPQRPVPPAAPGAGPASPAVGQPGKWIATPSGQPRTRESEAAAGEQQPDSAVPLAADRVVMAAPPRGTALEPGSVQHEQPSVAPAAGPRIDPSPGAPVRSRPRALPATAPRVEAAAVPPAGARASGSGPPERPEQPSGVASAARTTPLAAATPAGSHVAVHVGSITLTVRPPAAAAMPSTPAPAAATAHQQPAAPAPQGLRFSASRHHLRWS